MNTKMHLSSDSYKGNEALIKSAEYEKRNESSCDSTLNYEEYSKNNSFLSDVTQNNALFHKEDAVWMDNVLCSNVNGGKTIVDCDQNMNVKSLQENSRLDNPSLSFSDLYDEGYDYWSNLAYGCGFENHTENNENVRTDAHYQDPKEKKWDFDFLNHHETQIEYLNGNETKTANFNKIQDLTEKNTGLPSIASTFSLFQPFTDFLNNFSDGNAIPKCDFESQSNSANVPIRKQTVETCKDKKKYHEDAFTCNGGGYSRECPQMSEEIFRLSPGNLMESSTRMKNTQGNQCDKEWESTFDCGSIDIIKNPFSQWEDNTEAELVAGGPPGVRNLIRKRVIEENARVGLSEPKVATDVNESLRNEDALLYLPVNREIPSQNINVANNSDAQNKYDVASRKISHEFTHQRVPSPVGNSQFFVSDCFTSESSVDSFNNQVIISSFDEEKEEMETFFQPASETELKVKTEHKRRKTKPLASKNKKYEESISSLIEEAQRKIAEAQHQNVPASKTIIVQPHTERLSADKIHNPTNLPIEPVGCNQVDTNSLVLILPDNFDISSLKKNNNQLYLVIDNASQSGSKMYLTSGLPNVKNNTILPSTAPANSFAYKDTEKTANISSQDTPFEIVVGKPNMTEDEVKNMLGSPRIQQLPSFNSNTRMTDVERNKLKPDLATKISSDVLFPNILSATPEKYENSIEIKLPQEMATFHSPQTSNQISGVLKKIALGKDKNAISQTSVPLKVEDPASNVPTPLLIESSHDKSDLNESGISEAFSKILKELDSLENATSSQQQQSDESETPDTSQSVNFYLPLNFFDAQSQNCIKTPVTVTSINNCGDAIASNPVQNFSSLSTAASSTTNTEFLQNISSHIKVNETASVRSSSSTNSSNQIVSILPLSFPSRVAPLVPRTLPPEVGNPQKFMQVLPQRKQCQVKKNVVKPKKESRKTVRELLREKYHKALEESIASGRVSNSTFRTISTSALRPLRRQTVSYYRPVIAPKVVVKPSICFLSRDSSAVHTAVATSNLGSYKSVSRPTIMILPSTTKGVTSQTMPQLTTTQAIPKRDLGQESIEVPISNATSGVPVLPPFKFSRVSVKDHRSRHFDLLCLQIGNFKVQDYSDNGRKVKSKFKVVFTKRQFVYEFPGSRCNVESVTATQIFHISIPFTKVEAMDIDSRVAVFRISGPPDVHVGKIGRRKGVVTSLKRLEYATPEYAILEGLHTCLIHKIILKKRQTFKLKMSLMAFDKRFQVLSGINIHEKELTTSKLLSTFEDELELIDVRKMINKPRKGLIRRLPQWDTPNSELKIAEEDDLQKLTTHVCSCRVSCKSVRCSCVKAAKSCNEGRYTCLCTNCDNPLTILHNLGINLSFALMDSCLFQNAYQIKDFEMYLRREVKLSCCNHVARVQECIPGTVLCPNIECDAMVQYSWCMSVVCYPERNPRNHCSFCGWCCFSSGRHCPECNKCYTTRPKSQNCPNCFPSNKYSPNIEDFNLKNSVPEPEAHIPDTTVPPLSYTTFNPEISAFTSNVPQKISLVPSQTQVPDNKASRQEEVIFVQLTKCEDRINNIDSTVLSRQDEESLHLIV